MSSVQAGLAGALPAFKTGGEGRGAATGAFSAAAIAGAGLPKSAFGAGESWLKFSGVEGAEGCGVSMAALLPNGS